MILYSLIFLLTFNTIESNSYCSRSHSRFVREYFARSLLPIYTKYSQPVPEKCPFSPVRDIYHNHENNKSKLDIFRWKCEICGKMFVKEADLDKHFDNRHNNSLNLGKNSVCLANYCRIFRCEFLMHKESKPQCYEATMNVLKNKCKEHLDLCIPRGAPLSIQNQLTIELRDNLCSYLTCSRYTDLPDYMKGPSFIKIFIVVFVLVLSVIAYVVINHTDFIFDESEMANLNEQIEELNQAIKNEEKSSSDPKLGFSDTSNLRQRPTVQKN